MARVTTTLQVTFPKAVAEQFGIRPGDEVDWVPADRFDARFPRKRPIATELLRTGIAQGSLRVPHQAIVEFVAAVARPTANGLPLLSPDDARREAEELLMQFDILYPTEGIVRGTLRGAAAYRLSWFDAHLWAYAEYFGLDEIVSEDFSTTACTGRCGCATHSSRDGPRAGVQ